MSSTYASVTVINISLLIIYNFFILNALLFEKTILFYSCLKLNFDIFGVTLLKPKSWLQ